MTNERLALDFSDVLTLSNVKVECDYIKYVTDKDSHWLTKCHHKKGQTTEWKQLNDYPFFEKKYHYSLIT